MEYTHTQNFDVTTFPFSSGAKEKVEDFRKAGLMSELQECIEMMFDGWEEMPTHTQINDLVWFDVENILDLMKDVYSNDKKKMKRIQKVVDMYE